MQPNGHNKKYGQWAATHGTNLGEGWGAWWQGKGEGAEPWQGVKWEGGGAPSPWVKKQTNGTKRLKKILRAFKKYPKLHFQGNFFIKLAKTDDTNINLPAQSNGEEIFRFQDPRMSPPAQRSRRGLDHPCAKPTLA